MIKSEACVISVSGKVRTKNEDNFYFAGDIRDINVSQESFITKDISCDSILAVFDGMGGEKNGAVASYLAAKTMKEINKNVADIDFNEIIYILNDMICKSNDDENSVMGSTAVLLKIVGDKAVVCNIGDSRAYLFRNGQLNQLTEDHTMAANAIKMQKMLGLEATDLGTRGENTLTQHLGIDPEEFILEPFISEEYQIREGDIFLLCSDGLTHMIKDEDIALVLNDNEDLTNKNRILQNLALEAGGKDNITIILIQCK